MLTSIYVAWSAAQAPGVKIFSMNDKSLAVLKYNYNTIYKMVLAENKIIECLNYISLKLLIIFNTWDASLNMWWIIENIYTYYYMYLICKFNNLNHMLSSNPINNLIVCTEYHNNKNYSFILSTCITV